MSGDQVATAGRSAGAGGGGVARVSRSMRRAAVLLALSATLAACGGDDALSTDEYRSEARSICQEATRATRQVQAPARTTNEAVAGYFEQLIAVTRRSSERFAELEPPDELQDEHEEALAANRAGIEEVERLIADLERGGDARALLQAAQTRLTDLSRRSDEAARALGVPECARQE